MVKDGSICPILFATVALATRMGELKTECVEYTKEDAKYLVDTSCCMKNGCAWWDKERGRCSMQKGA